MVTITIITIFTIICDEIITGKYRDTDFGDNDIRYVNIK